MRCQCQPQTYQTTTIIEPGMQTFMPINSCQSCSGMGYISSRKHHGKHKYCYDCTRVQNFCPRCNNTGFKKHGKPCKCGINFNY